MRKRHPKHDQICALLTEGHTNKAIRALTGADVSTIARIRAREGFGPATITARSQGPHPKDAAIRALITAGMNDHAIARELHADRVAIRRIRKETGIPKPPLQPLTLHEKWAARTRPVEGGHLEWTGERIGPGKSPVMRYKGATYSPTAIAYELRHGRPPQGYAIADCPHKQCVAPDHVDDEAGRQAKRQQLRLAKGRDDIPATCTAGHDQSIHGRLQPDARPYCEACKRDRKANPEGHRAATTNARAAVRRDIEALLRQDVPHMHIARQLGVGALAVQRTRETLGLPAPRSGPREQYSSHEDVFRAKTSPAADGHLRWNGRGAPYVRFRRRKVPAARVSFQLHYGRAPIGRLVSGCGTQGCLAGAHLTDQPMRAANRQALRSPALRYGSLEEAFRAQTSPAGGGHLRWNGGSTPVVCFSQQRHAAARVSFELHHGRPPVGRVLSSCDAVRCLAGGHLTDQPMRTANRQADKAMRAANRRADKAFAAIFGTTP